MRIISKAGTDQHGQTLRAVQRGVSAMVKADGCTTLNNWLLSCADRRPPLVAFLGALNLYLADEPVSLVPGDRVARSFDLKFYAVVSVAPDASTWDITLRSLDCGGIIKARPEELRRHNFGDPPDGSQVII